MHKSFYKHKWKTPIRREQIGWPKASQICEFLIIEKLSFWESPVKIRDLAGTPNVWHCYSENKGSFHQNRLHVKFEHYQEISKKSTLWIIVSKVSWLKVNLHLHIQHQHHHQQLHTCTLLHHFQRNSSHLEKIKQKTKYHTFLMCTLLHV